MEKVTQKLTFLLDAIKSLDKSIELFYEYQHIVIHHSTQKNKDLLMSMRDSMIQRFEYSVDLFWKVIKLYLQEQGIDAPIQSPRGVLREAVKVRLLSEHEGDECMKMVESRNKTSHIYHDLMAEEIAQLIPDYCALMKSVVERL